MWYTDKVRDFMPAMASYPKRLANWRYICFLLQSYSFPKSPFRAPQLEYLEYMANIFLSYNRESQALIGGLVRDLEELDYSVWFDQNLNGGQAWWDKILLEILECDFFYLFSPRPPSIPLRANESVAMLLALERL